MAIEGWVCVWDRALGGPSALLQRGAPALGRAGLGLDTCSAGGPLMVSYPFLISLSGQPCRGTHSLLRCANTSHRLLWPSSVHLPKVIPKIPADGLRAGAQPQHLSCFQALPWPWLWPPRRQGSGRGQAGWGVGMSWESTRSSRTWLPACAC